VNGENLILAKPAGGNPADPKPFRVVWVELRSKGFQGIRKITVSIRLKKMNSWGINKNSPLFG